ncbi:MAG TPA: class I SAM-dependent methyltransferase [Oculatellaceae cyanobacterium]
MSLASVPNPNASLVSTPFAGTLPSMDYYAVLKDVHALLQPKTYLEIGVGDGKAIAQALSTTVCIGVDPSLSIQKAPRGGTYLFEFTSDEFFAGSFLTDILSGASLDLAFIDGKHLFEFALRDFMNIERHCNNNSVVVVRDPLPLNAEMASREQSTQFWSGDIWKLIACLKQHRPDLSVTMLDVAPAGLAFISNLDPKSDVLEKNHFTIVRDYIPQGQTEYAQFMKNANRTSDLHSALAAARKFSMDRKLFHASRSLTAMVKPEKISEVVRYVPQVDAIPPKPVFETPHLTPHGGRRGSKPLKMLGVLLCYNDGDFVSDAVEALLENGHHILAWDHGSNDETAAMLDKYNGEFLQRHFLPREFDFYGLYAHVSRHIIENFGQSYDWVSWPDMDEILEGPTREKSYPEYVQEVLDSGCTHVQFENYNYWFTSADDWSIESPARRIRHYGLRPGCAPRIRAWRADVTNERWFNHNPLPGEKYPQHFKLRHYPMRTYEKAMRRLIADRHNLRREDANVHYENMAKHLDKMTIRPTSLHFDDGVSELSMDPIYPWEGMYRA